MTVALRAEMEAVEAAVWRAVAAARLRHRPDGELVEGVMAAVTVAVEAVTAEARRVAVTVTARELAAEREEAAAGTEPAEVPPGWRWCRGCGEVKALDGGYHRNTQGREGYATRCRECVNRRRRELDHGAIPVRGRRRWG